jgi:hypothetical protein
MRSAQTAPQSSSQRFTRIPRCSPSSEQAVCVCVCVCVCVWSLPHLLLSLTSRTVLVRITSRLLPWSRLPSACNRAVLSALSGEGRRLSCEVLLWSSFLSLSRSLALAHTHTHFLSLSCSLNAISLIPHSPSQLIRKPSDGAAARGHVRDRRGPARWRRRGRHSALK